MLVSQISTKRFWIDEHVIGIDPFSVEFSFGTEKVWINVRHNIPHFQTEIHDWCCRKTELVSCFCCENFCSSTFSTFDSASKLLNFVVHNKLKEFRLKDIHPARKLAISKYVDICLWKIMWTRCLDKADAKSREFG